MSGHFKEHDAEDTVTGAIERRSPAAVTGKEKKIPAELAYLWYLHYSDAPCEAVETFNGLSTSVFLCFVFHKTQVNVGYFISLLPIKRAPKSFRKHKFAVFLGL